MIALFLLSALFLIPSASANNECTAIAKDGNGVQIGASTTGFCMIQANCNDGYYPTGTTSSQSG